MRVNALGNPFSISRPKRPENKVSRFRERKSDETVDAPMLANPVAGMHMIAVCVASETGFDCLRHGKIPRLTLR